jgi:hypothetical protein
VLYPTVAADLLQTLDVLPHSTSQVTLNFVVPVDELPQPAHFGLIEILNPGVRVYFCRPQDLVASGTSNPMNVGQTDLDLLVAGQINSCDSWHINYLLSLMASSWLSTTKWPSFTSLPLLPPGVPTNQVCAVLALHDLALCAAVLNRWFHVQGLAPTPPSNEAGNHPLNGSPYLSPDPGPLSACLRSKPAYQFPISMPQ